MTNQLKSYVEKRLKESSKKMSESTHNGQLYEFHKGQFLALREVLDKRYRNDKK